MSDGNVLRKESKRWVAPKTSYEGDDWGNDYDDYDSYPDPVEEEDEEEEQEPAVTPRAENPPYEQSHGLKNIPEEGKPSIGPRKLSARKPLPPSAANMATSALQSHSSEPIRGPSGEPANHDASEAENGPTDQTSPGQTSTAQDLEAEHHIHGADKAEEKSGPDADGAVDRSAESAADGAAYGGDGADDDGSSSIQDIYGFYENRYSVHPYNAILGESQSSGPHNDFSDSTASLSTGRGSMHSVLPDRGSADYQPELYKVPEVNKEEAEDEDSRSVSNSIGHLNIRKGHSRDTSLDTAKISEDGPNSLNTSPERPYSQVLDTDIAELYQGSSEFLNRPFSTYNAMPQIKDISDDSIRDLLTPHMEQSGFESHTAQNSLEMPSFLVTSASPDKRPEEEPESSVDSNGSQRNAETSPQKNFATDYDYVDKASDQDVGSSGEESEASDVDGGESVKNDQEATGSRVHESHESFAHGSREPAFDELEGSKAGNGKHGDEELAGPNYGGNETRERELHERDSQSNDSQSNASQGVLVDNEDEHNKRPEAKKVAEQGAEQTPEPFILPSERNRLNSATGVGGSTTALTADDNNRFSQHSGSSMEGHVRGSSEVSGDSYATGVTSSSNHTEPNEDARSPESEDTSDRSATAGSTTATSLVASSTDAHPPGGFSHGADANQSTQVPQPIAAKVKRPPQVDFSALLNKSDTSSESRCEQMRILSAREAEYSSGLETWLMATLEQVDQSMKVYVNGVPPASDSHNLAIPTTAKVSNVMHSSASNTKEKLGKVSEKSKSFFAKVIR